MAKGKPTKPKVTTGAAADRTVRDIVAKSKSGQGTLTYTPSRRPAQKRGGR